MIISTPPQLPFPDFKWRWASLAPTEGLNNPPVFLGALRAFYQLEGEPANSDKLRDQLKNVQRETQTTVDLERSSPDRNLLRNSGQYWRALGLLKKNTPIELTPFGREVASGKITMAEFAAATISTLYLPNIKIQTPEECAIWGKYGIEIEPLKLILNIMNELYAIEPEKGYLTKNELTKIIIPLSAIHTIIEDYVDTILAYRDNTIDFKNWPNCVPDANDHRMAAEFLLFLSYYGYCTKKEDRFYFEVLDQNIIQNIIYNKFPPEPRAAIQAQSGVADFVTRQRVVREVLNRPSQSKFRKNVLAQSNGECIITGTRLSAALEAAHIIPVSENGSDEFSNGFCMRSDIHTLYDSGHLRLDTQGAIHLSTLAQQDPVYRQLPSNIIIPAYINTANVAWRWSYM